MYFSKIHFKAHVIPIGMKKLISKIIKTIMFPLFERKTMVIDHFKPAAELN